MNSIILYACESWTLTRHSTDPKKITSHGNEMLPRVTVYLIQRLCYQRGSPCQDLAGNQTTPNPLDHCKETQTVVVWSCLQFIRSDQNHLARHSKTGKKTRQTEKRWEDNIREWTGLEFGKPQEAVENRENGGNRLRNHLWCPNDPGS